MAKAESSIVEVEIAGPRNENLSFRPLQRKLRGRFDISRVAEPQARMKSAEWPEPIPGQRLRLDFATGEASVIEPLHEPAHAVLRDKLSARGFKIGPASEALGAVHVPTVAFWIGRAVSAGMARVVAGRMPEEIEGTPQTSFITARVPTSNDRLATALEKVGDLLSAVLDRLGKQG